MGGEPCQEAISKTLPSLYRTGLKRCSAALAPRTRCTLAGAHGHAERLARGVRHIRTRERCRALSDVLWTSPLIGDRRGWIALARDDRLDRSVWFECTAIRTESPWNSALRATAFECVGERLTLANTRRCEQCITNHRITIVPDDVNAFHITYHTDVCDGTSIPCRIA